MVAVVVVVVVVVVDVAVVVIVGMLPLQFFFPLLHINKTCSRTPHYFSFMCEGKGCRRIEREQLHWQILKGRAGLLRAK